MKFFFCFSLLFIFVPLLVDGKNSTKCDNYKADQCASQLVSISDVRFLKNPPKGVSDLTKWCKKQKSAEDCIRQFSNDCLHSVAKQTMNIVMYAVNKANKKVCSSRKRKQIMVDIFKCLSNDPIKFSSMFANMTANLHAIRGYKPQNLRVPITCCMLYKFKDDSLKSTENICPEMLNEIDSILQAYTSDLLNFSCGDYTEESDKCLSLQTKVPKWNKPLEWNSFLIPAAQLFEE